MSITIESARQWMQPQWGWLSLLSLVLIAPAAHAENVSRNHTLELTPGFSPQLIEINGVTGGSVAAPQIVGTTDSPTGQCVGYADRQPDYILALGQFFTGLQVRVESNNDTTLMVQGPGGVWCNDDANSQDPVISGQWQEGNYLIWVGSYQANQYYPFTLLIEEP